MSAGLLSEWFAMREMAIRLAAREYGADEIAEAMHGWVDDAVTFIRRTENANVIPVELARGRWAGRYYEQPCTGCGAMLASRDPIHPRECWCLTCSESEVRRAAG